MRWNFELPSITTILNPKSDDKICQHPTKYNVLSDLIFKLRISSVFDKRLHWIFDLQSSSDCQPSTSLDFWRTYSYLIEFSTVNFVRFLTFNFVGFSTQNFKLCRIFDLQLHRIWKKNSMVTRVIIVSYTKTLVFENI